MDLTDPLFSEGFHHPLGGKKRDLFRLLNRGGDAFHSDLIQCLNIQGNSSFRLQFRIYYNKRLLFCQFLC